jgi:hypothetical protein
MDSNVDTAAARRAFGHYLRTGRRSVIIFAGGDRRRLETKFNPYHDPTNGRFIFAPGGPRSLYRDTERYFTASRPPGPGAGAATAMSAHFKTR